MAATKAMTGPVLMTSSGVPDFIRELFFVPIQGGYAHLMQRTKEERPLHRDQGGGLSGGEPAQFEEFRRRPMGSGRCSLLKGCFSDSLLRLAFSPAFRGLNLRSIRRGQAVVRW